MNDLDRIHHWYMKSDIDEPWHTSTTTGDIGNRPDFWSVATHELGHSTGFYPYHFDDHPDEAQYPHNYSGCADTASQQTMCSIHYPGTSRMRTPASHDIDAIFGAYFI
jgi:hypothetical protein